MEYTQGITLPASPCAENSPGSLLHDVSVGLLVDHQLCFLLARNFIRTDDLSQLLRALSTQLNYYQYLYLI